jgi:hypothetical protein
METNSNPTVRVAYSQTKAKIVTLTLSGDPFRKFCPALVERYIAKWRRKTRRIVKDGYDSGTVLLDDGTNNLGLSGSAPHDHARWESIDVLVQMRLPSRRKSELQVRSRAARRGTSSNRS